MFWKVTQYSFHMQLVTYDVNFSVRILPSVLTLRAAAQISSLHVPLTI